MLIGFHLTWHHRRHGRLIEAHMIFFLSILALHLLALFVYLLDLLPDLFLHPLFNPPLIKLGGLLPLAARRTTILFPLLPRLRELLLLLQPLLP